MSHNPPIPVIDDVPARANLIIRRGITFSRTLVRKNLDGTPIDITGHTFLGKILSVDGTTTIATFTIAIVDGPNGKLRVSLTSGVTAALTLGSYPDYITYTNLAGDTFMLLLGQSLVQNIVF